MTSTTQTSAQISHQQYSKNFTGFGIRQLALSMPSTGSTTGTVTITRTGGTLTFDVSAPSPGGLFSGTLPANAGATPEWTLTQESKSSTSSTWKLSHKTTSRDDPEDPEDTETFTAEGVDLWPPEGSRHDD